jgi:hypothetical protein
MAALPTSVKIFRSDMTGAPTLNGVAGALLALLKACLVDGYGLKTVDSIVVSGGVATANISTGHGLFAMAVALLAGVTPAGLNGEKKVLSISTTTVTFDATGIADGTYNPAGMTIKMAPANWDMPFSTTNKCCFRSKAADATRMFLAIDDTGTTTARVRGFEMMTDYQSGTGPFPTDTQASGGLYWGKSSAADATARQWYVIANDRTLYFGVMAGTVSSGMSSMMFGDIKSRKDYDPYSCIIMGSTSAANIISAGSQYSGDVMVSDFGYGYTTMRFMPRGYQLIGSSKSVLSVSQYHGSAAASALNSGGSSFFVTYPDPSDNSLVYSKMLAIHDASVRGELPGFYFIPQIASANIGNYDIFQPTTGALAGRTLLAIRSGVGGTSTVMGVGLFDITGDW